MKIALCISGHVRDYKRLSHNYLEFKNYIANYGDVDVFVSTWNKQNTSTCWSGMHGLSAENSNTIYIDKEDVKNSFQATDITVYDYDFYASEFSPLQYKYLTNNIYDWHPNGEHNGVVHSSKMVFLIYQANILKLQHEYLNQTRYDWVFRIRPDMEFHPTVYPHILNLNNLDNNKIYMFSIFHDQFALGGSNIMNKYANIFLKFAHVFDRNIFGDPEAVCENAIVDILLRENIQTIPKLGFLISEKINSAIPYR